MKKLISLIVFSIIVTIAAFSQSITYVTYGTEMIFSLASIEDDGNSESSLLRWAPFLNIQTLLNKDLSDKFGIFSGLAIRNVGYIYDNYTDPTNATTYKKKFRSYNLGIPLGIKVGNLEKLYAYGGYEVEFPFLYKEKNFDNGDKFGKITGWFSKRQEAIQHGFLVGIQFPYGPNVKFKYYLSEFHNQEFTDAGGIKPYEGLKSNIFYFSLNYIFRGVKLD